MAHHVVESDKLLPQDGGSETNNPAPRMPSNEGLIRAGLLQACCQPIRCSLLEMKLKNTGWSTSEDTSLEPTLAFCVGLPTQFRNKPISPHADVETRKRGPPLAAHAKKIY